MGLLRNFKAKTLTSSQVKNIKTNKFLNKIKRLPNLASKC